MFFVSYLIMTHILYAHDIYFKLKIMHWYLYKERSNWPREMSLFLKGLDELGGGLVVVEDGLLGGGLVVSHPLAGPAGWGVRPVRRRGLTVAARRGWRGGGAGGSGWAVAPAQEQRHTLDEGSGLHSDTRDCLLLSVAAGQRVIQQ